MVTPATFIQGTLLTAAAALYYTSPPLARSIIKKLTITNNDAVNAHTVAIWKVPSGGAAINANLLIATRPIGPLACFDVIEAQNHELEPGDMIYAQGDDVTHLNIEASGVRII